MLDLHSEKLTVRSNLFPKELVNIVDYCCTIKS